MIYFAATRHYYAELPGYKPHLIRPTTPTMKTPSRLQKDDFEALSEFRYQLRRFIRFSEDAAQSEGMTALQYLLMLHIKGFPGRDWASIGELAERLQSQHHGVVALVSRCEKLKLVKRQPSEIDRRQVNVHLLPAGERCLAKLAELHHAELNTLSDIFRVPTINT